MAKIRAYTTVEQSRKLVEILPLESADMAWCNNSIRGINYTDPFSANLHTVKEMQECFDKALNGWDKYWELIPCWSLAALLDILPNNENISTNLSKGGYRISTLEYTNSWFVDYEDETNGFNNCVTSADNPIDACYEMILKLNELNLL